MRRIQIVRHGKVGIIAFSLFSTAALADTAGGGVPASSLQPIPVTILAASPKTAGGLIFLTPTNAAPGARGGATDHRRAGAPRVVQPTAGR